MTHTFPTRRSSDLRGGLVALGARGVQFGVLEVEGHADVGTSLGGPVAHCGELAEARGEVLVASDNGGEGSVGVLPLVRDGAGAGGERSEEHTSELQSLMRISYAVFCLKKKQ